jgi:hypothetical protein
MAMVPKVHAEYAGAAFESYEYLGDSKVLVSIETTGGERVWYMITTAELIDSINRATECMNKNLAQVLGTQTFLFAILFRCASNYACIPAQGPSQRRRHES